MANKYPGECRHCWQHIDAGDGDAVRTGTAWQVEHHGAPAGCPDNPHAPADGGLVEISRGEGYGGTGHRPGAVVRETWRRDANPGLAFPGQYDDGAMQSGIAVVVASRSIYYAQEGMSFGVGAETGRMFATRLRPATAAEAQPVLAREQTAEHRDALTRRCAELFAWRGPCPDDAEYVPAADVGDLFELPQVPLAPPGRDPGGRVPLDELRLDEPAARAWTLVYNGADGDDWSRNNLGPFIALAHPLTGDRRALIADLRDEYAWSMAAYIAAGADPETAPGLVPALLAAGIPADRLGRLGALELHGTDDVAAYTARTPQQWADAGWPATGATGGNVMHRFPAAEAARLADAGITGYLASALRTGGYRTAREILAARPEQIPDTATRIVLRDGRTAQVTDDPQAARDWLDRHPDAWRQPVRVDTDPIRCMHVTPNAIGWVGNFGARPYQPWQLWDDGSMSLGGWLRGADVDRDAYERPRSLPDAAEYAVTLALSSTNGRTVWGPPGDRTLRGPLTGITGLAASSQVDKAEQHRATSGVSYTLHRHDYDHPDGPITIWQLLTEGWAMGEDGDEWTEFATYRDETAARGALREAAGRLR